MTPRDSAQLCVTRTPSIRTRLTMLYLAVVFRFRAPAPETIL